MEPATAALIIIILGVLLIIIEATSPGAFMVIPGTVLVIVGIAGYIVPDFLFSIYSPIAAVVLAVPVTILTIYMYRKLAKPAPPTTSVSDALVGKKGIVIVRTSPTDLKGKVKIGSETWSADSAESIGENEEVVVVSTEGVHITVKRA